MTRTLRRWTVVSSLAVLAALVAGPAEASRAALYSRALPPDLAPDASELFVYPAGVGTMESQVLLDDDFAMALGGGRTRFGYLVDGQVHNLIVGRGGAWGITLGFRDGYSSSEDERERYDINPSDRHDISHTFYGDNSRNAERAFRLGLGWHGGNPRGRQYEMSVVGSLVQAQGISEFFQEQSSGDDSASVSFDSNTGLSGELGVRTLSPAAGLLASLRLFYEDLRPTWKGPFTAPLIRRSLALDAGWRLHTDRLDDLVVGISLGWTDRNTVVMSGGYGSATFTAREATTYAGRLFVSGERGVTPELVVRAGLSAPATFSITDSRRKSMGDGAGDISLDQNTSGSLGNPDISLGVGWTWRFIQVDGYVSESLSLTYPVARWAAKVAF